MQGHPDGQNYAIWRGTELGFGTNVHIDSTHPITTQGQVTNFSGIQVYIGPASFNGIFLVATFFTDATQAQFTGQKQWQMTKSQGMRFVMPSLGNYVVINMTTTDVTGGAVTYAFTPTNLAAPSARYNGIQAVAAASGQSIAANTTVIVPMSLLAEGPAYAYLNDGLASGKLLMKIVSLDPTGAAGSTLLQKPTTQQTLSQNFIAPDFAIGVLIDNTDATAAHPADFWLAIDGR